MNKILTIVCAIVVSMGFAAAQEQITDYESIMYKRGYRADIELGATTGNQFDITSSHGYSFGNGLYVGGGIGFGAEFQPDIKAKPIYYVPIFSDVKYTFMNRKCSPFVGLRLGEIVDLTQNALKTTLNPSVGIDIVRVSIKISYDLQYNAIGYPKNGFSHYARFGVGFTF